ncbi:MMPL family transporter [Streptomyces sp. NBC_01808]|uniref:MMPL family transporter n=1 Tax=Streptomyces sp. NBC_01808 TaxID=2975947 RepID=UPI002DD7A2AA|nr:MMPL family transporter [Streptomyces sp. NBC_01808]WSA40842.1 MMPL family transporter [Streptomyces sp. NBC_01808]
MSGLARWCLRRRLVVVLLWLAAFAGTAVAAALLGPAYSNDYDVPGTESGRAQVLMAEAFPGMDGVADTVVWHDDGGVSDAQTKERVDAALTEIAGLPGVSEVSGPYGSYAAGDPGGDAGAPTGNGAGDGGAVSADGRTAYATVSYDGAVDDLATGDVRKVVGAAETAAGDGLEVAVGGPGAGLLQAPSVHYGEAVGVVVAAVVLFVAFGSLAAMALPIATALVGVGTAYWCVTLLGHAMAVADFAPMLGMLVGLGVGIDYALFIVTRHRRGLREGLPVGEAAQRAVATAGRAVVFAGVTVCIALLGMLVLRLNFLTGVAVAASLTVVLTVAASITLLPALLGVIGMKALSRRERRALVEHGPRPEVPRGLAARWAGLVQRRPRLLGALALVLMGVLALPVAALHLGSSDQGNHPASATTRQAYDMMAGGFGPGSNGPLTLVAHLDGAGDRVAFDALPETLRGTPGVADATAAVHGKGGGTGMITVTPETAPQDEATSDLVDRLRSDVLPEAADGTSMQVHVGGITAGQDDFAEVIVGKLPLFGGIVIALGCLLLLVAFRSVGVPLKAALMNVLAVTASFGVVVAVFQWGWGAGLLGLGATGPIEPFLPVIMISVLFGLSMDYQVFLVSRMYEEWRATRDNRRAVRVGLAETGRVINCAALIMIAVFSAFALGGDRIIAMFGVALAAAVALDAFVLRTLLVPALMHLLGRANWWLPGWLEKRLPYIGVEGPGEPAAAEHIRLPQETAVR